jgi:hypothetical protein
MQEDQRRGAIAAFRDVYGCAVCIDEAMGHFAHPIQSDAGSAQPALASRENRWR